MKRSPLRRYTPLRAKSRLRPHAKHAKAARVVNREYVAWLHTQRSIVPVAELPFPTTSAGYWREIEAHHHVPGNDLSAVPLPRWLHRETRWSVHGGGGRRKFEERWGISFEAEIIRLRALYEYETGRIAA